MGVLRNIINKVKRMSNEIEISGLGVATPIDQNRDVSVTVRENEQGLFQVWKGNKVLDPKRLKWENYYQAYHDFMWVRSKKRAIEIAKEALKKHTVVKETEIFLR